MTTRDSVATLLGIVVVNYGSHRLIGRNLTLDQVAIPAQVVVVDNYSGIPERQAIEALCASRGWTLVRCDENVGFGAGVNRGVAAAQRLGCTAFLLLNPDASLDTSTATTLLAASAADPKALVAPRIVTSAGHEQAAGNQVSVLTGQIRRAPDGSGTDGQVLDDEGEWRSWLTGACLVVGNELWQAAGGMADDYFLYWEDIDFSMRCRAAGARLIVRRDLTVRHDEGGTQRRATRAKSNVYYCYNCRSRLLFARRHLGRAEQWRWVRATPRQSWRILLRGGRRQLLHSPGPLAATVLGSVSGLRLLAHPVHSTTSRHTEMKVHG